VVQWTGEQVAAVGRGGLAAGALLEAGLAGCVELVGDERVVRLFADGPFFLGAQAGSVAVVAGGGEVEAVPDDPAGVDGVLQH
jgi:hypothetical protein